MKVLIVTDQLILMDRLRSMMADMQNLQVLEEAANAAQAMQRLEQDKPDLVLLDMHLQSGMGMDVLAAIREKYASIKVIVLVNYDFPQYKKKCAAMGVEYVLDKSKGIAELQKIVTGLSSGHPVNQA